MQNTNEEVKVGRNEWIIAGVILFFIFGCISGYYLRQPGQVIEKIPDFRNYNEEASMKIVNHYINTFYEYYGKDGRENEVIFRDRANFYNVATPLWREDIEVKTLIEAYRAGAPYSIRAVQDKLRDICTGNTNGLPDDLDGGYIPSWETPDFDEDQIINFTGKPWVS